MRKGTVSVLAVGLLLGVLPALSQVKMTREQMMFYSSDWKGDRFPDGRPKVADDLLKRALGCLDRRCLGLLEGERLPQSV